VVGLFALTWLVAAGVWRLGLARPLLDL
jgi:hypothetical protein